LAAALGIATEFRTHIMRWTNARAIFDLIHMVSGERHKSTSDEDAMASNSAGPQGDIALAISPIRRISLSEQALAREDLRHRRIDDLNARAAKFTDCNFSYSIFTRGYFRDARFTNCQFTGCQFYDCNLKNVHFYTCDLRFIRFFRCQVDAEEIVAALPFEPNIRREVLQNLRANAASIGDFASQRLLILQEIDANKDHYWRALRGVDTYYREKYSSTVSKIEAGWRLLWLRISGLVWGHGERPGRILFSGATILIILTLINFWGVMPRVGWTQSLGGIRILEYTLSMFFGAPTDPSLRGFLLVDYAILTTRYIYIGLYISVLFRKISYR
jgi:hypothetical protein